MASFVKFDSFVEALAEGKHNFAVDSLKVMLTNTAPASTDSVKADLTEIATGNGYTAGGNAVLVTSSAQVSGTYALKLSDPATWTASGGAMATFQYVVLYNDSAADDDLIAYWDHGSSVALADGESFAVEFNSATGVLTIV
jgi:hypothetical protein